VSGHFAILDPDGDAILKVGGNPTNQSKDRDEGSGCALQIRISTKLLAMSSPVFKAMLDGQFATSPYRPGVRIQKKSRQDIGRGGQVAGCQTGHFSGPRSNTSPQPLAGSIARQALLIPYPGNLPYLHAVI
jgi:hypothetical protein